MGAGDVKLALGLGALTGAFGPDVWLLGALGAPVLTALGKLPAVRPSIRTRLAWWLANAHPQVSPAQRSDPDRAGAP